MWLTILKYAAKVAVFTGVVEWGSSWLRKKIIKAADKAEDLANKKLTELEVKADAIFAELDKDN